MNPQIDSAFIEDALISDIIRIYEAEIHQINRGISNTYHRIDNHNNIEDILSYELEVLTSYFFRFRNIYWPTGDDQRTLFRSHVLRTLCNAPPNLPTEIKEVVTLRQSLTHIDDRIDKSLFPLPKDLTEPNDWKMDESDRNTATIASVREFLWIESIRYVVLFGNRYDLRGASFLVNKMATTMRELADYHIYDDYIIEMAVELFKFAPIILKDEYISIFSKAFQHGTQPDH